MGDVIPFPPRGRAGVEQLIGAQLCHSIEHFRADETPDGWLFTLSGYLDDDDSDPRKLIASTVGPMLIHIAGPLAHQIKTALDPHPATVKRRKMRGR